MVKEDLEKLAALPRWVPHNKNPSDAMTKDQGAHSAPLYRSLKDHTWRMTFDEEELRRRALIREEFGYNPRHKQSDLPTVNEELEDIGDDPNDAIMTIR